jgi:carboxylesterase
MPYRDQPGAPRRSHLPWLLASMGIGMAAGVAAGFWRRAYVDALAGDLARRLEVGDDGVVRGASPISLTGTRDAAVLLLHGAGDTPRTLRLTARALHDRGFTARVPLLPGHGRSLEAYGQVSADQLMDEVRDEYAALRRQYRWVAVVGLSMGGALAVRLAASRGDIPAMVLVAPYLQMPAAARLISAASPLWGRVVPALRTTDARSIHDPVERAASLGYGVMTPAGLRALEDTAQAAWQVLPQVSAPTLVIQSPGDNRVSVDACHQGYARLGAGTKELLWVTGCGHVITVDRQHRRVNGAVVRWLEPRAPALAAAG